VISRCKSPVTLGCSCLTPMPPDFEQTNPTQARVLIQLSPLVTVLPNAGAKFDFLKDQVSVSNLCA
jgi:hypothetical protein